MKAFEFITDGQLSPFGLIVLVAGFIAISLVLGWLDTKKKSTKNS
jgi:hypothetical protein